MLKIRWLVVTAVLGLILITSTSSTPTQALSAPFPPAVVGDAEMMLIGRGLPTGTAFAPDGQTLAVATNIGVWLYPLDALDAGHFGTLSAGSFLRHTVPVSQINWLVDGQRLTSVTADNQMHIWDTTTGQLLQTEEAAVETVTRANDEQSPDGRLQATISEDEQTIVVADANSGQIQQTLTGHTDTITSFAWSPDGQQLATTADDDTVRLWRMTDGQLLHTFGQHYFENVRTVDWSPNGHFGKLNTVEPLSEGSFLLGGLGDDRLRIWTIDGQLVQTLVGHTDDVTDGRWSPDGRQIASSADDGTVRLWDAATGNLLRTLEGTGQSITSVSWSPDGRFLAAGVNEGQFFIFDKNSPILVWEAASGALLHTLTGHKAAVRSVVWSADGRFLASGSDDNTVRIWDAAGKLLRTFRGHTAAVRSVAWSPDGRFLASGSADNTVRIWDAAEGKLLFALRGHTDLVRGVSWSPDGRFLASGSDDFTTIIWDAGSGQPWRTLVGHTDYVRGVDWSADGHFGELSAGYFLATSSDDNTVRIWQIE
ncbi:MAG: hypothetical protein CL608_10435 [Anaerolineaceae bacterium]|nr:hypothetical protein [Anaerolineaceae bacterium]